MVHPSLAAFMHDLKENEQMTYFLTTRKTAEFILTMAFLVPSRDDLMSLDKHPEEQCRSLH